jgi:hypothetical protein
MNQELVTKISTASRTKGELQELADQCKDLQPAQYDEILESLLETYDGPGVSNLLYISALNKITLNPETFVESIMMTDEENAVYAAGEYQQENAVPYLMDYGYKWSWGVPSAALIAMYLAVKLTVEHNMRDERNNIKKILKAMAYMTTDKVVRGDLTILYNWVESGMIKTQQSDPRKILPERIFRSTLPAKHNRIMPWQAGRTDPSKLPDRQLIDNLKLLSFAGFTNKIGAYFNEVVNRNKRELIAESNVYLLDFAAKFKNAEIFNIFFSNGKIENWNKKHSKRLFDLFEILEILIKDKVKGAPVNVYDIISKVAAYHYPSVAIIFSRAEMTDCTDPELIEEYMTRIKQSRVHLELDPDSDPIKGIYDQIKKKDYYKKLEESIEKLTEKVSDLELTISQLKSQLKEKSSTNKRLGNEVKELNLKVIGDKEYRTVKAERDSLLPRVEQLKMDNKTYSTMIADLKGENRALREKVAELESTPANEAMPLEMDLSDDGEAVDINRMPKTFTIPIFEESFINSLKRLDVAIQRKAWDDANGFAATRKDTWRKTCPLKGLKGYYRIKFDPNYRIMLKWENGDPMHFIEVIPRQEMETWIKNKA